ncbi:MAG: methylenetetrahydrofolate--tRNA-(uracil(54)-C(5))-methyltransferase (FADH(2)-oxidizing) TrmFO, partial [Aggregatilineales bacterium]
MTQAVIVIGAGLAGSEAAWQLAERGIPCKLYEMRPRKMTGAHTSERLAELVCSNSLGSKIPDRATGLLQHEMQMMRSLLMQCATHAAVPAGGALAVDREKFAQSVTDAISEHSLIELIREEVTEIPIDSPTIIATGPLTSLTLSEDIGRLTGQEYLYFYDALSPILEADSIDMSIAFKANRYDRGETEDGDYINCPFNKEEYYRLVDALHDAEIIEL